MSMKRVVGAAAVAASVGLLAPTQNAGFAYAVPLDPPCPNCNSGPGGWPQEPATTTVAPANTEPRGGERSEPPSTQSTARRPAHKAARRPAHKAARRPARKAPKRRLRRALRRPARKAAPPRPAHRAPPRPAQKARPRPAHRAHCTRVQHRKHDRVQHREHYGVQHTQPAVGCAEHTTPSPALRSARRFRSGYCGSWRSRGCVCRLQHRGPRRAASAAGARVRLE